MYRNKNQRDFARQLRKRMTDAERTLWKAIRCEQLHLFKFRRQAAVGDYIVDFVCFESKLIVELDGGQHNELDAQEYDQQRTVWLESQGFCLLRYWNHDVLADCDAVVEAIWIALGKPNRTVPSTLNQDKENSGGEPTGGSSPLP